MSIQLTTTELAEETRLLEQLVQLLTDARATRPDRPPLNETLDKQAELCEVLSQHRARRSERLQAEGYGPRDLLVALLANTPKDDHQRAVATFGAFVEAAERAQAEIDINREFFTVALSAVEDALTAASPQAEATYTASGARPRPGGSVLVSTDT